MVAQDHAAGLCANKRKRSWENFTNDSSPSKVGQYSPMGKQVLRAKAEDHYKMGESSIVGSRSIFGKLDDSTAMRRGFRGASPSTDIAIDMADFDAHFNSIYDPTGHSDEQALVRNRAERMSLASFERATRITRTAASRLRPVAVPAYNDVEEHDAPLLSGHDWTTPATLFGLNAPMRVQVDLEHNFSGAAGENEREEWQELDEQATDTLGFTRYHTRDYSSDDTMKDDSSNDGIVPSLFGLDAPMDIQVDLGPGFDDNEASVEDRDEWQEVHEQSAETLSLCDNGYWASSANNSSDRGPPLVNHMGLTWEIFNEEEFNELDDDDDSYFWISTGPRY